MGVVADHRRIGEGNEKDAVRKRRVENGFGVNAAFGGVKGETRFADAAGTDKSDELGGGIVEIGGDLSELLFAPNQRRELRREVVRGGCGGRKDTLIERSGL